MISIYAQPVREVETDPPPVLAAASSKWSIPQNTDMMNCSWILGTMTLLFL